MNLDELNLGDHDDSVYPFHDQAQIRENLSELLDDPSVDLHDRNHVLHTESSRRVTDIMSDNGLGSSFIPDNRRKQSIKPSQFGEVLLQMQKKIASLENQIKAFSENEGHADGSSQTIVSNAQVDGLVAARPSEDILPKQILMTAQIREASWVDFMHKFEEDDKEYAIEVLVGEPEYQRMPDKFVGGKRRTANKLKVGFQNLNTPTKSVSPPKILSSVPDRIRINSTYILDALAKFDKSIDASAPIVMLGPYKLLTHFEEKIRELAHLTRDRSPYPESLSEKHSMVSVNGEVRDPLTLEYDSHDDIQAQHLQCLVQFIDLYVKPVSNHLRHNSEGKVHFQDLWYLFPPGEDILMPLKDRQNHVSSDPLKITPEMLQGRYERMWRVIGAGGGRTNMFMTSDRDLRIRQNAFQVNCYYIDFDGTYFCPIIHTFSIQPFSGEREITSLDFFPLRYAERGRELWTSKSQKQGRLVFDALQRSHTHFYYRGPTLTTQPCGCPMQGDSLHQEYIESEVIIDYRTTLMKRPLWRTQPSFWRKPPSKDDEVRGKHRVRYYQDRTKSQLVTIELDQIYDDNIIDKEMALLYKDKARIFDPVPSAWLSNEQSVPEHDIALLSPRVFVFVLRNRSFAPVWLWGLQKISAQTDGLHNLQLRDNTFKDTIHALVRTHFLQKNCYKDSDSNLDMTQGKGKGLVLLLHGAPGVGKTFTAESIAAANGRPLFQITCGDLGLTPSEVERALKEIFQYAQLWNCVLLLDECDIFLTQRTKADLKRNSLVSVFLRVLEWYNGVLFLTTNRVGTLDSAVRSRITWSTYYPPLNQAQTREIWKASLDLLEKRHEDIEIDKKSIMKFAREHFESSFSDELNWNGRQIQNAFKVAVSLADWDTLTGEEQQATDTGLAIKNTARRPKLTASHFRVVADAADVFDQYILKATGLTEAQRAWNAQERADDYQDDEEAIETNGNPQIIEPPSKRRRASSMVSGMQAPSYEGNASLFQSSFSSKRRQSSSQHTKPSLSRRASQQQQLQQQISNARPTLNKSGSHSKNGYDPNGTAATTQSLSPVLNQRSFLDHKRKRSITNLNGSRRSPMSNIDMDEETDSSDEMLHIVNDSIDVDAIDEAIDDDAGGSDDGW